MSVSSGKSVPSDSELVERTQAGDATAFELLVRRYQDRVYNMAYRMCRNTADAFDITQDTFVRALRALPQFQLRANFFTWLFRIGVNVALTQRRKEARRHAFSLTRQETGGDSDPPAFEPAVAGDPAGASTRRELSARIEEALEQVEAEYRTAVILKDVEELDYSEIAEILDVPIGTVKSRIFRGREALRRLLADWQDWGS
ncbi:MAG: sigma-70 family RNA polymerase sigma factor [Planctomycetes bacterium]|nr:sigma-70 family RNA polymerase sigma factor [Planctomycetota bacterium]